jgi:diguanylate cyclase (GGDEF)-like protein
VDRVTNNRWKKGELYELLCLLAIGQCLWLIGETSGLSSSTAAWAQERGLSSIVSLGFFMSFFLAIGSFRKSLQLRHEMGARAEAEAEAHSIARQDALTGLPNRRSLIELIEAAVMEGSATRSWALFLIDLDRFKLVNDAYGHEAGDAVLGKMAERLTSLTPEGGTSARLGGDEFAMLVPYGSRAELAKHAEDVIALVVSPIAYQHAQLGVGATVGIARYPDDGATPEALLRCADLAMYCGKHEGRNTFRFFEMRMDQQLRDRASLETSLLSAITKGEIRPHYQPLVSMPDNSVHGFEILARWYHPEKGMLPPDAFIRIAEETGLITELSYELLRQACLDARNWPSNLTLSINISQHQLKDLMLAERLLAILAQTKFDPARLEVEVTETALTSDIEAARVNLGALQSAGVSVALDDFGTGYSSLAHLRDIKFDRIKIDRSFVQSLGECAESGKIIDAVLALGRSLGVRTTAEGIESAMDSQWLAERGCTDGQGFYFGKPMPASAVNSRLGAGDFRKPSGQWSADSSRAIPTTDIVHLSRMAG